MKSDLDVIKYRYGERMMKLCRDELSKLLEFTGLLPNLLDQFFCRQKNLAEDIIDQGKVDDFKKFLYEKSNLNKNQSNIYTNKKAIELLAEKGYVLYPECLTEKDIQSFRHYYYSYCKTPKYIEGKKPEPHTGEELCTFNGGRLLTNRVWFAVHKDAEKLKRENFKFPQRQDKYGTSVLSIQFSKNENSTLSIKNRYNHTVYNSDNTFNNNLDNIVPGLSLAFGRDYGVYDKIQNIKSDFELDGYVMANDGKFYPYNYEINNVYYCPNNIIIDNLEVKHLPTHQLLIDYFIVDFKTKEIKMYRNSHYDSFIDNLKENRLIEIEKNGFIKITKKDGGIVTIGVNKRNRIEVIKDNSIRKTGEQYLAKSEFLKQLYLPQVQECSSGFLYYNNSLEVLEMPKLRWCKDFFLYSNEVLKQLNLPNLLSCGDYFLNSTTMESIYLPLLQKCGEDFLFSALCLVKASFPSLCECGNNFMYYSKDLEKLVAPKLRKCGNSFLYLNEQLINLFLPQLQVCGIEFLYCNSLVKKVQFDQLQACGRGFMAFNKALKEFFVPELQECGKGFLNHNETLEKIFAPNLIYCDDDFLRYNNAIKYLYFPLLKIVGKNFLYHNNVLKILDLPKIQKCSDNFMFHNNSLKKINVQNLLFCGRAFLYHNNSLHNIKTPLLVQYGEDCLFRNNRCRDFDMDIQNYKQKTARLHNFRLMCSSKFLKVKNEIMKFFNNGRGV